jgi:prevent-host-death family protein
MAEPARRWRVKDARASFSELVDRALSEGPQVVTRRGRPAVVVVSAEEWERRNRRRGDLVDFFAASPLREEGLEIPRLADRPREVGL